MDLDKPATKKPMSSIMILKQYFGFQPGKGLKDFAAEVKALTPEDKQELADLAAKELGVSIVEPTPAAS